MKLGSDHVPLPIPIHMFDCKTEAPSYAYEGDAGLDLRASEACVLQPFERAAISCGFAVAIPDGYAGLVIPRSGLAAKHGISVVNGPGLIDSGYRGEVKVILVNLDPHKPFEIVPGDRIAQLMIVSVPAVKLELVDELPESTRGMQGFGSSGIS